MTFTGLFLLFTLRLLIFLTIVMLLTLVGVGLHEKRVQREEENLKKKMCKEL